MNKTAPTQAVRRAAAREAQTNLIHPVIIYPFAQTKDYSNLESLYGLVASLDKDPKRYARPLTVIDRKTHLAANSDSRYHEFRDKVVARYSDTLDAWCVDTCQMWYTGMGLAFERGAPGHVYWLIPGDFNYGTSVGKDVLSRLHDLPEIILELEQDLCIGEIATDHSNSKQLIDTYGTFALLYNWFPSEAEEIRQFTERPRSEFFAVRHEFLKEILALRWFAYEQTVVMLLHAILNRKRVSRFFVGNISDLPEGRESLSSAIQQVERTERVLKAVWRELHEQDMNWTDRYQLLEGKSEQVRRSAMTILQNLLR